MTNHWMIMCVLVTEQTGKQRQTEPGVTEDTPPTRPKMKIKRNIEENKYVQWEIAIISLG